MLSVLLLVATLPAQAPDPESSHAAPRPPPSARLAALLTEAVGLLDQQQWRKALAAGDEALDLARQLEQRPAVALAQRARAQAMVRLGLGDDAVAAWRDALDVWRDLGDRPRQVEGLAGVGNLLVAQDALRAGSRPPRAARTRPRSSRQGAGQPAGDHRAPG